MGLDGHLVSLDLWAYVNSFVPRNGNVSVRCYTSYVLSTQCDSGEWAPGIRGVTIPASPGRVSAEFSTVGSAKFRTDRFYVFQLEEVGANNSLGAYGLSTSTNHCISGGCSAGGIPYFVLTTSPAYPVSGNITSNTTWNASTTYEIIGSVTVNAGVTLTIEPGTIVKFSSSTSSLAVEGQLLAVGTDAEKIYFTSAKDDTVGVDLTASSTVASAGDWAYLRTATSGITRLEDTVIRYGGAGNEGQISNFGGTLRIASSTVATSSSYGVYTNNISASTSVKHSNIHDSTYGVMTSSGFLSLSSSTISSNVRGINLPGGNNDIHDAWIYANTYGVHSDNVNVLVLGSSNIYDNDTGIYINSGGPGKNNISSSNIYSNDYGIVVNSGTARIYANSFHGNSNYGILSNDSSTTTKATYNIWNASDGPAGVGPGTGDSVSSNVLYTPFATSTRYFVTIDNEGSILTAVDGNGKVYWDGTPNYESEWHAAVKIWNDQNLVELATSTGTTTATMHLATESSSGSGLIAQWSAADQTLTVNTIEMNPLSFASRVNVLAHEIGHALGLAHSTTGNIMYLYETGLTTLGAQDLMDYNFIHGQ
jgi:hypothetical protein